MKGLEQAGKVVLGAVDKAVELRWDQAMEVAASTQGSADERIRQIKRAFAREMSAVGAAAGATAAVPGAGAVALVGTTVVELGWFTARSADLILSVAAVHGQTESTVEQRRAWILSVLAFGDGASAGFTKLAGEMGKGLGKRTTAAIPNEALKAINKALGRTIVTKYGTKRGVIALGRALPFGIGAVIGGTTNYAFARTIAHQADEFFRLLPPPLKVIGPAVEGIPPRRTHAVASDSSLGCHAPIPGAVAPRRVCEAGQRSSRGSS